MATEGSDDGTGAAWMDEESEAEVMENDAAAAVDATASLDDAVASGISNTSSSSAEMDISESRTLHSDAGNAAAANDSGAADSATDHVEESQQEDVTRETAKEQKSQEDDGDEKLNILPNSGDDPIIVPVIGTKTDLIEDEAADSGEEIVNTEESAEGQMENAGEEETSSDSTLEPDDGEGDSTGNEQDESTGELIPGTKDESEILADDREVDSPLETMDTNEEKGEADDSSNPSSTSEKETETPKSAESTQLTYAKGEDTKSENSSAEIDTSNKDTKDSPSSDTNATDGTRNDSKKDAHDDGPRQIKLVDYASKLAGAQVLEQSPSLKGTSNLLTGDKDKYSIAPCEDKKYVVVGLSEDILVKQIKLSNYERYSSRVKVFQVLASQEYPIPNEEYWNDIGTYEAQSKSGEQMFELKEPAWARYLKVRFLSHYGSEHYCTLTQIKVHGSTMLQGFHEQWIESEKKDMELEQGDEGGAGEEGEGQEQEQPIEDEGTAVEESTEPDEVEDDIHDSEESDETEGDEVVADDESSSAEETPDAHDDELEAATTVQEEEAEMEVVSAEHDAGEAIDDKSVDEAPHNSSETNEMKFEDTEKPADTEEIASATDSVEVSENDGTPKQEEVPFKDTESNAAKGTMDEEPDEKQTKSDDAGDEGGAIQSELKESVPTKDGGESMRNDSSIAAVTDVVKAAVSDASDAIKNATSDAIKNVKDAISTTVSSPKVGEAENESATLDEETKTINAEGESGSTSAKKSDKAKQDGPTKESTAQSADTKTPPKGDEGSAKKTPDDAAKTRINESPPKTKEATAPKAKEGASKEKKESRMKTKEAKKETTPALLKDSAKTTSPGRDMLHRGTITLAGKDGKGMDVSPGELYAQLSRRFPHAVCMKDLDFQAFKSKKLLANAGGNGGGPAGSGGAKMEPIFAKITNEIKSVQITQNQYEQYVSALTTCYETVLWDVAKDLDSVQSSVDQRLASLERAVFLSEMRANHPHSPSYDRMLTLFSGLPFAASAFQFTVMPVVTENSPALLVGIAIFLLFWCWPHSKKSKAERSNEAIQKVQETISIPAISPVTSPRANETNATTLVQIPELVSENDLQLLGKLASSSEKLGGLQTEHKSLKEEHASLQQRYAELEQRLQNQMKQTSDQEEHNPKQEIKHVVFSGTSACSTPTPSVQSEPASSEQLCATPSRSTKNSPLKNRFRKKKSMS